MTIQEDNQNNTGFISHLIELRDRLLKIIAGICVVLIVLLPFAGQLYSILAEPLLSHLPENSSMIAIDVISPFLIPFKLALLLAIFITVPYIFYHVWAFVAPGLYKHEKRLIFPLLLSSTVLFYLGVAFAYYVAFPIIFGFIINIAPEGIEVMTDISRYLDFAVALFLAFGLAFEIPVATVLLVAIGVVTPSTLAAQRAYVIVAAFVVGMLLTPPDVISQMLLALPMWVLFELGVIASRLVFKQRNSAAEPIEEKDHL